MNLEQNDKQLKNVVHSLFIVMKDIISLINLYELDLKSDHFILSLVLCLVVELLKIPPFYISRSTDSMLLRSCL